jgi:transposase
VDSLHLCNSVQVRKNRKGLKEFQQSEVEPGSVPYLDPIREKARQRVLRQALAAGSTPGASKAQKKRARNVATAKVVERVSYDKKLPAAKRQHQQFKEDVCDLEEDYLLYRKHVKGKVKDDEYKRSIGIVD